MHDAAKTMCMKLFPKLAQRTNLTPEELKVYYAIRFTYILPFNEKVKAHEQSLLSLAMVLLRAGKIRFELHPEMINDEGSTILEEEKKSNEVMPIHQIGI